MKSKLVLLALLTALSAAGCDPALLESENIVPGVPLIKDSHDDLSGGGGGDDDGDDDGPDPTPSCPGGAAFAISESDSASNVSHGELRDGIFPLYLWKLEGSGISALQGDITVEGGSFFPGSFSAAEPFFSITLTDGPDILMAVGGCPCPEMLVGVMWVEAGAEGIRVGLVPGSGGGAVNCATNPQPTGFSCTAYSSR